MRRDLLACALVILAIVPAAGAAEEQALMDAKTAEATRYDGTVAIWYGTHFEDTAIHDWDPIREWNGPFHPVLGEYKTDDPKVVRQHLKWLRRAGVDVVFCDICRVQPELTLFGIGKQKTLRLLAEELSHQEKESRKLRLAVLIEKWNSNPTPEQYRFGLDYILKNLASRDFYHRLDDKPLVVTYLNRPDPRIDALDKEYADRLSIRRLSPGRDAPGWRYFGPGGTPECRTVNPGADGYMEHAFIAKYIRNKPVNDEALRRHGKEVIAQRADGKFFENQLLTVRQANPKMIFIAGWNDWAYCMQMEPAKEYGFLYVDMAARLLGRWAETEPYRKGE